MPNRETATASLEERVRAVEDRLAIYNLIASHPPSADTGADYYTRAVYAEDGVFDRGPHAGGQGNAAIAAVTKTPEHQAAIAGGLAHFAGLPYVDPNGAPVELPNHGTSKGFRIHRVAANRWELIRTQAGWKIKRRTLRPLDGSEPARQILRQALKGYEGNAR